MDQLTIQSCRDLKEKKTVKKFWNYVSPQRCKEVILVLPINVTPGGEEANVGAHGSYFISQKPSGSRAGHLHVLALGRPCSRWTVSEVISDPKRAPWLWASLYPQRAPQRHRLPQFPILLASKILWFSLFLFRRKRS